MSELEGAGIFLRRPKDLDTGRLVKAGIKWVAVAQTYRDRPITGYDVAARAAKDAGLGLALWSWFPELLFGAASEDSLRSAYVLRADEYWANVEADASGATDEAALYASGLWIEAADHGIPVRLCSYGVPPRTFPLSALISQGLGGVAQAYDRYGAYNLKYPDQCRKAWAKAGCTDLIMGVGAFVDPDGAGPDDARWRTPAEIRRHLELFKFKPGDAWIAWPPVGRPSLPVLRAIAQGGM